MDQSTAPIAPNVEAAEEHTLDPIWTSSRTARQIHDLGEVEKSIVRLLQLAASSTSLLTLPQTDDPGDNLPQGEERSEKFVLEVTEFFDCLDMVQNDIRSSLAHIRHSKIAPSAINAPSHIIIPPTLGVGLPPGDNATAPNERSQGLQETRIEKDAWKGIADALQKLKDARNKDVVNNRS